MGKTRFMVIKLKELIKTVIFAILGAAIIITLIMFLMPGRADEKYNSGTYTTNITMGSESAALSLTFSKTEITDISFIPASDTLAVFYPLAQDAANGICQQILDNQSTQNIKLSSDYQFTGELIVNAADACISRAKK